MRGGSEDIFGDQGKRGDLGGKRSREKWRTKGGRGKGSIPTFLVRFPNSNSITIEIFQSIFFFSFQSHGDTKSTTGGAYHIETMKASDGTYIAKIQGAPDSSTVTIAAADAAEPSFSRYCRTSLKAHFHRRSGSGKCPWDKLVMFQTPFRVKGW